MNTAAPEKVIRHYLDENGGSTTATVEHLLTSFRVAPEDPQGRQRIVRALSSEGLILDRPIDSLEPQAKLTVALL